MFSFREKPKSKPYRFTLVVIILLFQNSVAHANHDSLLSASLITTLKTLLN